MPKYRVTLRRTSVETIDAENPYQAAVLASGRHGGDVEIANVAPAVGRAPATKTPAKNSVKKAAKKRRQLSPEARAKLAQNLVKARAARAAKRKTVAKKAPAKKKATTKKTARARKATTKRASIRA